MIEIPLEGLPQKYRDRITPDAEGHWHWTGAMRGEYGIVFTGYLEPKPGVKRSLTKRAHREIYQLAIGRALDQVQETCHHLCEFKDCVNPAHIQILSRSEHMKLHHPPTLTDEQRAERKAAQREYLARWKAENPERWREIGRKSDRKHAITRNAKRRERARIKREALRKNQELHGQMLATQFACEDLRVKPSPPQTDQQRFETSKPISLSSWIGDY